MRQEHRTAVKLLAVCLDYPDAALVEALPEIEALLQPMGTAELKGPLVAFAANLKAQPLLSIQEAYTAAFDLDPAASLNLACHLAGAREEQGRVMSELVDHYHRSGFEVAGRELPDYLPLLLEWIGASGTAPDAAPGTALQRCLATLPAIAAHLRQGGSDYAGLLELACTLLALPAPDRPKEGE
jgi:nitrate reductase delta subunit